MKLKLLLIVLSLLAAGCQPADCPDSEKVVVGYEVHDNYNTTTIEPILECPR